MIRNFLEQLYEFWIGAYILSLFLKTIRDETEKDPARIVYKEFKQALTSFALVSGYIICALHGDGLAT